MTPLTNAKPYANEGIRLTTAEGVSDLTPPPGGEFTINFPGGFLFVTHEGCALGLNPLARREAVVSWTDPKLDRLISEFGGVSVEPPADDAFERIRDRSLAWHPKGAYVVGTRAGGRLRLRFDTPAAPGFCDVIDCHEESAGQHPDLPPNTVRVNLCAKHHAEVKRG